MLKAFLAFGLVSTMAWPMSFVVAQELTPDTRTILKAEVVDVVAQEERQVLGTDAMSSYQTLEVRLLEGDQKGSVVRIENDFLSLTSGETFYLMHTTSEFDGADYYTVIEPYRLPALAVLTIVFIISAILFGGWQGLRGLLSLGASLAVIFFVLFPSVLAGYSPIVVSVGIASLIVILGSYITHGFNWTTTSAVMGMVLTIVVTGMFAYGAVYGARLSGFESDEAVYLNLNTRGAVDFTALLLGGILIGLLGVLYDAAISQAIAVEELRRVGPHVPRRYILSRALRMGREHIGALVNTLAIAYVGASLPLLLLFYSSSENVLFSINRELFASEIVRTVVGSIGVILTVPITTLVAVAILIPRAKDAPSSLVDSERAALDHAGHEH